MRPPPASRARRLAGGVLRWLVIGSAFLAALALWRSDWAVAVRTGWALSRLPPPAWLPVPVQGVRARGIADTYDAPRGGGRNHQGVDIFAARGTPVVSATRGIVAAVRDGGLGGRQVWVLGPAGERHYYAHLHDWAPGLARGDVVAPGDALGTVGTTGNARGTPPHLHYGIYRVGGAYDPLPLLRATPPARTSVEAAP